MTDKNLSLRDSDGRPLAAQTRGRGPDFRAELGSAQPDPSALSREVQARCEAAAARRMGSGAPTIPTIEERVADLQRRLSTSEALAIELKVRLASLEAVQEAKGTEPVATLRGRGIRPPDAA